jgi:glycosyltransferase involved in cell wall biosynthesis
MPSPHNAPWIRALAEKVPDCEVVAVFQTELTVDRLSLGWTQPDYGKVQVLVAPDIATIDNLLNKDSNRVVNVVSSFASNRMLRMIINRLLRSKTLLGIGSEGRDPRGWKGGLRRIHALFHETRYQKRVNFVLAVGHLATKWYMRCGYDPAKIFPFCYVAEANKVDDLKVNLANENITLTSVGQLIPRKRFDLLLSTLARIPGDHWKLKIIGDGVERLALEKMVKSLGMQNKTIFMGVLNNQRVRKELATTDIFLLCSRWDGWGTVVNEALMNGVPVICSDYCGASDLIRPGFNGDLFKCDSIYSLEQVINKWISKGPLKPELREKIRCWSRFIEADSVSEYFLEIINHLTPDTSRKPKIPWFDLKP